MYVKKKIQMRKLCGKFNIFIKIIHMINWSDWFNWNDWGPDRLQGLDVLIYLKKKERIIRFVQHLH